MPFMGEAAALNMLASQFGRVSTTAPAQYEVAVITQAPSPDSDEPLIEPYDPAYSRILISNNTTEFVSNLNDLTIRNANKWSWPQATTDWGGVSGLAFYVPSDDRTGELLHFFDLETDKSILSGDTMVVEPRQFILTPDTAPVTIFLDQPAEGAMVLTSPNGTRYIQTVGNLGDLVNTPTDMPGPPTPPLSFSYSGGYFSWTAPVSNGGVPITGYIVRYFDGSEVQAFPVAQDVTTYPWSSGSGVFTVVAENPFGTSAPSESVTIP